MALRKNKTYLHTIVAIPVACVILAAFAMSIAAVAENLHFINATNQILSFVSTVRMTASGQNTFIQAPGENIWADLQHMGQIATNVPHTNPWQGDLRATSLSDKIMRIESDLPTHDCRRLALYFLDHQPDELGLVAMEAQSTSDPGWTRIYPTQNTHVHIAQQACGAPPYSRLALIFKIR